MMLLHFILIFLSASIFIEAEEVKFIQKRIVENLPPNSFSKYWRIEATIKQETVGSVYLWLPYKENIGGPLFMAIQVNQNMRNLNIGMLLFEQAYEYACVNKYACLIMYGPENAESFEFVKKLMKKYSVKLEQDPSKLDCWKAKIAIG